MNINLYNYLHELSAWLFFPKIQAWENSQTSLIQTQKTIKPNTDTKDRQTSLM